MSKTYFGFGIAPSMFPSDCVIKRSSLTPEAAKALIEQGIVPCLNPSHAGSIQAMRSRFGIYVPIPEKAPSVNLAVGDAVIVMAIAGLPRLEGRHEYTEEDVAKATFDFSVFRVEAGEIFTPSMMEEVWRLMGLGCPTTEELAAPMRARFMKK